MKTSHAAHFLPKAKVNPGDRQSPAPHADVSSNIFKNPQRLGWRRHRAEGKFHGSFQQPCHLFPYKVQVGACSRPCPTSSTQDPQTLFDICSTTRDSIRVCFQPLFISLGPGDVCKATKRSPGWKTQCNMNQLVFTTHESSK